MWMLNLIMSKTPMASAKVRSGCSCIVLFKVSYNLS